MWGGGGGSRLSTIPGNLNTPDVPPSYNPQCRSPQPLHLCPIWSLCSASCWVFRGIRWTPRSGCLPTLQARYGGGGSLRVHCDSGHPNLPGREANCVGRCQPWGIPMPTLGGGWPWKGSEVPELPGRTSKPQHGSHPTNLLGAWLAPASLR